MPHITLNQTTFYYELHGRGQPLVLISGYAGNHTSWLPILPQLTPYFQVLLLHNRGAGQTQDDGRTLSAELMAEDVVALCQALKLQKPHVVGHSMGGTIAQMLALRHGDFISKLVILTSSAKWRRATIDCLNATVQLQIAGVDFGLVAQVIAPWLWGERFLKNPENLARYNASIMTDPNPPTIANQQRQADVLRNFDSRADLHRIKNPTLVIAGREDLLSLPFESEFLANHIPNARLAIIEECAHKLQHEAPDELSQLLLEFLT